MNHKDLINTCVFEQFEGLLFSDLSGPLSFKSINTIFELSCPPYTHIHEDSVAAVHNTQLDF